MVSGRSKAQAKAAGQPQLAPPLNSLARLQTAKLECTPSKLIDGRF